jgi:hypothetical protein
MIPFKNLLKIPTRNRNKRNMTIPFYTYIIT